MPTKPKTYIMEKPWGRFLEFVHNAQCTVKILVVKPGEILSDQRHKSRSEFWYHLTSGATVSLNGKKTYPKDGAETWIPQGTWHRLGAKPSVKGLVQVLEISLGSFDENDIERRNDKYGRTG